MVPLLVGECEVGCGSVRFVPVRYGGRTGWGGVIAGGAR